MPNSIEELISKEKPEGTPRGVLKIKLSDIDIKRKEQEAQAQAGFLNLPYIDLKGFPITPEAISLIPKTEADKLKVVGFFLQKKQARLGAVNPEDKEVEVLSQRIAEESNYKVNIYKISEFSFGKALKFYETLPKIIKTKPGLEITETVLEKFKSQIKKVSDLKPLLKKVSTTDLVALIIAGGVSFRASDIHIEAEEDGVKIRYRIDGVLNNVAIFDNALWEKALSRIKLLAGLKLNVKAKPQDGRFTIFLTKEQIDVRAATLSTAYGEGVVMRLLMSSAASLKLEGLGLRQEDHVILSEAIKKVNGMILTTGPTGAGKTTTLYAILNELNSPDKKVITLEDPIEYKLKGINQSQVNPDKGYTFANGLRALVRQDPDILMVGEIRDLETAEIAIDAALTGHLVVSTLHTNNAPAAIPRLLSLGVKPSLLGSALNLVIAQRLVRRLCPDCKEETKLDAKTKTKIKKYLSNLPKNFKLDLDNAKFYTPKGCKKCSSFGYHGRVAIMEILVINKKIQDILKDDTTEKQITDIAIESGMLTMAQDGLLKATEGTTSVDEVFRVIS